MCKVEPAGALAPPPTDGPQKIRARQLTRTEVPVCFPAGTAILLADGATKPIEQIVRGEKVRAVMHDDPEGPISVGEVVEVYHHEPRNLVEVEVGGGLIRCTPKHPFYVRGRSWTAAAELRPGDSLRLDTGGWITVGSVVDKGEVEPVFNIQVAGLHTYFVRNGGGNADVLVHNASGDAGDVVIIPVAGRLVDVSFIVAAYRKEIQRIEKDIENLEVLVGGESYYLEDLKKQLRENPNDPNGHIRTHIAEQEKIVTPLKKRLDEANEVLREQKYHLWQLTVRPFEEQAANAARWKRATTREVDVIEAALVQATNEIAQEMKGGKIVPRTTRFILEGEGGARVLNPAVPRGDLEAILAGDPRARLFAMSVDKEGTPIEITIDEFYNGTDEEILNAVAHRAAAILYEQKSAMEKAGEAVDLIQEALGFLSLFPVVGDVATGADGLIDLGKGNWAGAGISAAALIPIFGEEAAVLKISEKFAARIARIGELAKLAKIGEKSKNIIRTVRMAMRMDRLGEAIAWRFVFKDGEFYIGKWAFGVVEKLKGKNGALLEAALRNAKSLEEAKAIFKKFTGISIETMHLLPKEFLPEFKAAGLTLEEFTVEIDKALHRKKVGLGLHTNDGGNWNRVWREFFEAKKDVTMTKEMILDQLRKMLEDFNLVE
jgi:hypothetical protein